MLYLSIAYALLAHNITPPSLAMKYATIENGRHGVNKALFTSDGNTLYYNSFKNVYSWTIDTKLRKIVYTAAEFGVINDICVSKDGSQLFIAEDKTIIIYEIASQKKTVFCNNNTYIQQVVLSNDDKHVITGDFDGYVRMWSTETQLQTDELLCSPKSVVKNIVRTPDATIYIVICQEGVAEGGVIRSLANAYCINFTSKTSTLYTNVSAWFAQPDISSNGKTYVFPFGKRGVNYDSILGLDVSDPGTEIIPPVDCPLDPVACRFIRADEYLVVAGSKKDAPVRGLVSGEIACYDVGNKKWIFHEKILNYEVHWLDYSPKRNLIAAVSRDNGEISIYTLR